MPGRWCDCASPPACRRYVVRATVNEPAATPLPEGKGDPAAALRAPRGPGRTQPPDCSAALGLMPPGSPTRWPQCEGPLILHNPRNAGPLPPLCRHRRAGALSAREEAGLSRAPPAHGRGSRPMPAGYRKTPAAAPHRPCTRTALARSGQRGRPLPAIPVCRTFDEQSSCRLPERRPFYRNRKSRSVIAWPTSMLFTSICVVCLPSASTRIRRCGSFTPATSRQSSNSMRRT